MTGRMLLPRLLVGTQGCPQTPQWTTIHWKLVSLGLFQEKQTDPLSDRDLIEKCVMPVLMVSFQYCCNHRCMWSDSCPRI